MDYVIEDGIVKLQDVSLVKTTNYHELCDNFGEYQREPYSTVLEGVQRLTGQVLNHYLECTPNEIIAMTQANDIVVDIYEGNDNFYVLWTFRTNPGAGSRLWTFGKEYEIEPSGNWGLPATAHAPEPFCFAERPNNVLSRMATKGGIN